MRLTDILTLNRIKVPLESTTKEGVITELVDLLVAGGDVTDREKVLQAVLDREKTRTTGIGSGLAIPHGKSAGPRDLTMAVGRTREPIDFQSIDGKPVTLVILLVSPTDKTGPHIQALARISRLVSVDAFRNKLNAAASAADLLRIVKDQEKDEESA